MRKFYEYALQWFFIALAIAAQSFLEYGFDFAGAFFGVLACIVIIVFWIVRRHIKIYSLSLSFGVAEIFFALVMLLLISWRRALIPFLMGIICLIVGLAVKRQGVAKQTN